MLGEFMWPRGGMSRGGMSRPDSHLSWACLPSHRSWGLDSGRPKGRGKGGAALQEPGPLAHHSGLGWDFVLAWSLASVWTVPLETRAPPLTLTLTLGRDPHTAAS